MRAFFLNTVWRWFGAICGVICIILFWVFSRFPIVAEAIYGNGIYPLVRFVLDFSFGILPFPVVYFLPFGLIVIVLVAIKKKGARNIFRASFNSFGAVIAMFYILWGFNYSRSTIKDRLELQAIPISNNSITSLVVDCAKELNTIRSLLPSDPGHIKITEDSMDKLTILAHQEAVLNGFSTLNHITYREINPSGALRKWGITGIYMPFTGEGLIEKSQNILEKPFVIAHELAHGFGITDEGEANLIAYLACKKSDNLLIQYNAHIAMWQYLRHENHRLELQDVDSLTNLLSKAVSCDMAFIKADHQKYPQWFPQLSNSVNDVYLKTHGVESGVEAYNSLPMLYLKYSIKKAAQKEPL